MALNIMKLYRCDDINGPKHHEFKKAFGHIHGPTHCVIKKGLVTSMVLNTTNLYRCVDRHGPKHYELFYVW